MPVPQWIGAVDGLLAQFDLEHFARPAVRLLVAMVLGGLIGWERERHGRPAGLRTHLLLCVGCTLTMLVSQFMTAKFSAMAAASGTMAGMRTDPSRIAAQVMSGIGFLGAGVILTTGVTVRGLTTAACLWVTAAMGLALGCGYWTPPLVTFVLVMFALLTLGRLEGKMPRRDRYSRLTLDFTRPGEHIEKVKGFLSQHACALLTYKMDRQQEHTTYTLSLRHSMPLHLERLSAALMERLQDKGLHGLRWE